MKSLLSPAIFILSMLFLPACSKERNCGEINSNEGIITSRVIIGCWQIPADEMVIENDSAYDASFPANCERPEIDFNVHTLLGVSSRGGCHPNYYRNVERIDNEKRYIYRVTVISCGECQMLALSNNWVLVPKLPDGWSVSFEVKEE